MCRKNWPDRPAGVCLPGAEKIQMSVPSAPRSRVFALGLGLLLLSSGGCISWHSKDGTRHTLILGLGLVSTRETEDAGAVALRAAALGMTVRPPQGGLILGYHRLQYTAIPPGWEGIVQVDATPGQPLTVRGIAPGVPPAPLVSPLIPPESPP